MYAEIDEHQVLEGDPVELVCLLYGKAVEKLALARGLTSLDEVQERNRAIARAAEIIIELQSSLDLERGGEIAANLERLYEYIQQRLAAGLAERSDEALAEAGGLLETLAEGWRDASDSRKGAMKRPEPRAEETELALAGAGRSWTV
ncbi:MAG: flagellar protein FliS [Acidobacteria bacterium]|nr:flagellar protein FliS [Acidobacteriota bacterium]